MKLILALLATLFAASAYADEDTIDMNRAIFVSLADQHVVPFIDPDGNSPGPERGGLGRVTRLGRAGGPLASR